MRTGTVVRKRLAKGPGSAQGGRSFSIKRRVKQHDIISPMLFNAGLEHAMRNWKQKLRNHGLHVRKQERFTNVRFADDIMLYAKSCNQLIHMLQKSDLGAGRHWIAVEVAENKNLNNRFASEPYFPGSGCQFCGSVMG